MLESRKILVDEYEAIADNHQRYTVQKYQCFTVTFLSDGTEKDIPGNVEYRLRNGMPLQVTDTDCPQDPVHFEIPTTHTHLHLLH